MSGLMNAVVKRLAPYYQFIAFLKLGPTGLHYDDLLIEKPAMLKALSRTDATYRVGRERRIARAFDLSAKRKDLPIEPLDNVDFPFNMHLAELAEVAQDEMAEKVVMRS